MFISYEKRDFEQDNIPVYNIIVSDSSMLRVRDVHAGRVRLLPDLRQGPGGPVRRALPGNNNIPQMKALEVLQGLKELISARWTSRAPMHDNDIFTEYPIANQPQKMLRRPNHYTSTPSILDLIVFNVYKMKQDLYFTASCWTKVSQATLRRCALSMLHKQNLL